MGENQRWAVSRFEWARTVGDALSPAEILLYEEGASEPFADVGFYSAAADAAPRSASGREHLRFDVAYRKSVLAILEAPGAKRVEKGAAGVGLQIPWMKAATPSQEQEPVVDDPVRWPACSTGVDPGRAVEHRSRRAMLKLLDSPTAGIEAWAGIPVIASQSLSQSECQYLHCLFVAEDADVCPPYFYERSGHENLNVFLPTAYLPTFLEAAFPPGLVCVYTREGDVQRAAFSSERLPGWRLEVFGRAEERCWQVVETRFPA